MSHHKIIRYARLILTVIILGISVIIFYPPLNIIQAQSGCTKIVTKGDGGDFATIQAGVNALSSGQTLCVKGDNSTKYEEVITVTKPNITIKNYPGNKPVIDGRYSRALLTGGGDSLRMPNASTGNYLPGGSNPLNAAMMTISANGVTVDGLIFQNIAGRGITIGASDVTVKNSSFYWIYGAAIVSNPNDTANLTHIVVKDNKALFASVGSLDSARVAGSNAEDPASGVMKFGNLRGSLLVSGNYIAYGYGEGINVGKDNQPASPSEPIIIERNVIHDTRHKMIYVNSGSYIHVRNNLAFSSDPGIMLGGKMAGGSIGIVDENPDKTNYPDSRDVYFYNNVVVNGQKQNFGMGRSHNNISNLYVGFNTFVAGPNSDQANIKSSQSISLTGIIENNIFYGKTTKGNFGNMKFRSNLWYPDTPPSELFGEGSINQQPKLRDPNSSIQPAKFPGETPNTYLNFTDLQFLGNGYQSDLNISDYSLNSDSPAINRAGSRSAVSGFMPPQDAYSTDFLGKTRTNPDMGALESDSNGAPPQQDLEGDLNGDRIINLSDYDLAKSQFGRPYNIYDFNNVISNFNQSL